LNLDVAVLSGGSNIAIRRNSCLLCMPGTQVYPRVFLDEVELRLLLGITNENWQHMLGQALSRVIGSQIIQRSGY
jgi:hypothetical protein